MQAVSVGLGSFCKDRALDTCIKTRTMDRRSNRIDICHETDIPTGTMRSLSSQKPTVTLCWASTQKRVFHITSLAPQHSATKPVKLYEDKGPSVDDMHPAPPNIYHTILPLFQQFGIQSHAGFLPSTVSTSPLDNLQKEGFYLTNLSSLLA